MDAKRTNIAEAESNANIKSRRDRTARCEIPLIGGAGGLDQSVFRRKTNEGGTLIAEAPQYMWTRSVQISQKPGAMQVKSLTPDYAEIIIFIPFFIDSPSGHGYGAAAKGSAGEKELSQIIFFHYRKP